MTVGVQKRLVGKELVSSDVGIANSESVARAASRVAPPGVGRYGRALGAAALVALLGACAGEPTIQTGPDAETIMDGRLARVDNTRSSLVYVDPDADYGRYNSVLLVPLDVDHIEIIQPDATSSVANRFNRDWELTDSDRTRLQDAFREAMEKAINDGGSFSLAEETGEDVLRVEAMITQIAPTAPKDDVQSRGTRSTIITEGAGSLSVAIMLVDGDSGEVLAIIKDTRSGQNNINTINNSVTNMAEVRRHFRTWGTQLNNGLLALQERANAMPE